MERSIWSEKYPEDSYPAFPCARCPKGFLRRVKGKTTMVWDPSDEPLIGRGKFASFFACSNTFCGAVAVMSGACSSGPYYYTDQDGEDQMEEEVKFFPKSMVPGPRVIVLPSRTPAAVHKAIDSAFDLLWTDPSCVINRLRVAVEEITADHRIERETADGDFIPLAHRLAAFEALGIGHHDTMVALKDVGNTGSHEGALKFADCLDAFDILEDALEDIYGGRKARQDAIRRRFTRPKKTKAVKKDG